MSEIVTSKKFTLDFDDIYSQTYQPYTNKLHKYYCTHNNVKLKIKVIM